MSVSGFSAPTAPTPPTPPTAPTAPTAPTQVNAGQERFGAVLNNMSRDYVAHSLGNSLTKATNLTPQTNHQQAAEQSLQALGGDLSNLNANLGNNPAQASKVNPNLRALAQDYSNLVQDEKRGDAGAAAKDFSKLQTDLNKLGAALGGEANGSKDMLLQTVSDVGYLQGAIKDQASDAGLISDAPSTPVGPAEGKNTLAKEAAANIQKTNNTPLAHGDEGGLTRLGQQFTRAIQGDVASIAANSGLLGGAVGDAVKQLIKDSGQLRTDASNKNQSAKEAGAVADVTKLDADVANVVKALQAQTGGLYGNKGALLSLTKDLQALSQQLSAQMGQPSTTPPTPAPASAPTEVPIYTTAAK